MGLRKLLDKVKPIFRNKASRAASPLENFNDSQPGVPGVGTHSSRPDSPGESNHHRDIKKSETRSDIRVTQPSTFHSRNLRAAAGNDANEELLVQLGQPKFNDIKNSAISVGTGPVNVSNVTIQNNTPSERIRPGLELLQKRVATSAFHNSAQRVDPPRCHPDTRVAIQNQIHDWIVLLLTREMWIMWMHGAAGAGKSAIMQSIAERCEEEQIALASFFFFRTDPSRNSMTPFIATLVYQLVQKIPQVRDEIFTIIESNPLIFDESLGSQFQKLIVQPLLRAQEHFKHFFVVLIDGLDECIERAHQTDLIKLLGTISRSRSTPVIFLVGSRREPQIEAAFVRKEISDLVLTLPLDNSDIEQTSDDIRHFLVDEFSDIKDTHLLKRYLPINWPPVTFIEEIVNKSSGQFIFASVVMNYVSSPRTNPAHQLEIVRGIRLRDPSSLNPFAHLDALYQHILSQVMALDKVFDIIALEIVCNPPPSLFHIKRTFQLEDSEIDVLFADLAAVILLDLDASKLQFLHASLPDFLIDKTRSDQYHIDLDKYRTKLLCMLLERHPPILDPLWSASLLKHEISQERSRLFMITLLLDGVKASERLHIAFMNFNSIFYTSSFLDSTWHLYGSSILRFLKSMDFSDQRKTYHHIVDMFAAQYAICWPSLDNSRKHLIERESSDLVVGINQILEQAYISATST